MTSRRLTGPRGCHTAGIAPSRAQLEAWRGLTSGPFGLSIIAGDHFFINSRRAELLALVTEKLDALVAAGSPRVPA